MLKTVTIKDILADEELFDAVLNKACFYFVLRHPEEYYRIIKKYKIDSISPKTAEKLKFKRYNVIIRE